MNTFTVRIYYQNFDKTCKVKCFYSHGPNALEDIRKRLSEVFESKYKVNSIIRDLEKQEKEKHLAPNVELFFCFEQGSSYLSQFMMYY